MANSLFKLKYDGTFSFIPEEKLMKEIRKAHTWFTKSPFGIIFPAIFAFIDFGGFFQLTVKTINSDNWTIAVMILAFLVAFELAPLYFGYALCLKSYGMGKQIHKYVMKFSLWSFVLGVLGNVLYRIMSFSYIQTPDEPTLAITILMIILPIITSLMSIVVGCLMFDPLLFEMNKTAKKINRLNIAKRQLEAAIKEYEDLDGESLSSFIDVENEIYSSKVKILEIQKQELYDYIDYKTAVYKK